MGYHATGQVPEAAQQYMGDRSGPQDYRLEVLEIARRANTATLQQHISPLHRLLHNGRDGSGQGSCCCA